jgi:hypothetical protein
MNGKKQTGIDQFAGVDVSCNIYLRLSTAGEAFTAARVPSSKFSQILQASSLLTGMHSTVGFSMMPDVKVEWLARLWCYLKH